MHRLIYTFIASNNLIIKIWSIVLKFYSASRNNEESWHFSHHVYGSWIILLLRLIITKISQIWVAKWILEIGEIYLDGKIIARLAFIYITMFFTLTKKWIIGLLRRRLVSTWKAFDDSEKNLIVILWNEISTSTRALTFAFFRVRVNWFSNSRTLSILFHFIPFYKFTKEQRNGTNSRIDLTINQTYYCHCQI